MAVPNDDRPDVKQADESDLEQARKIMGEFGASLSDAITKTADKLRKAMTPSFVLMILKHNYSLTPKWRFIRRYTLRRKIAEVEMLVELSKGDK